MSGVLFLAVLRPLNIINVQILAFDSDKANKRYKYRKMAVEHTSILYIYISH